MGSIHRHLLAEAWMANGVRLAWLIDPKSERTFVYRQGQATEETKGFQLALSGEEVCPGFELPLVGLRR